MKPLRDYSAPAGCLLRDHSTPTGLLQCSCRTLVSKMIEYMSFLLQCISVMILGATTCCLYSLLKMAEAHINDLLSEDPPDTKSQKLTECILNGNSKQHLGKAYTKERVNELSTEEVDKLFGIYEVKLSVQMVKSLGKSIIGMYLMGACAILGMSNQDALSDLESDPFLNSTLQRFT